MGKPVYNLFLITILLWSLTVKAYDVTLITKNGKPFTLDSDLLAANSCQEFNYPFTIQCPTIFAETFIYIITLLLHNKNRADDELIIYLSNKASILSEQELADILNTLEFLKLDNLLDFVLWRCALIKEKEVFKLCNDLLRTKLKTLNTYLCIKIPLENGFVYSLEVPINKAWRLPVIQAVAIDMSSACELDCLIKEPIELTLPASCVPLLNTTEYSKFFDTFFSTILYLSFKEGKFDDPAFFRNLFENPLLRSEQNIAAFCNLFDYFEVAPLLDCILGYIGFHAGNKAVLGNDCQGFNPLANVNFDELLKYLHPGSKASILEKYERGERSCKKLLDEERQFHKHLTKSQEKIYEEKMKKEAKVREDMVNNHPPLPIITPFRAGALVFPGLLGAIVLISKVFNK